MIAAVVALSDCETRDCRWRRVWAGCDVRFSSEMRRWSCQESNKSQAGNSSADPSSSHQTPRLALAQGPLLCVADAARRRVKGFVVAMVQFFGWSSDSGAAACAACFLRLLAKGLDDFTGMSTRTAATMIL